MIGALLHRDFHYCSSIIYIYSKFCFELSLEFCRDSKNEFESSKADLSGSVGCASDWRPGGRRFDPAKVGNILSWRLVVKYFLRSFSPSGVVGWCEGAVYLTSLGRPTDIGLQLGKACYPCSG